MEDPWRSGLVRVDSCRQKKFNLALRGYCTLVVELIAGVVQTILNITFLSFRKILRDFCIHIRGKPMYYDKQTCFYFNAVNTSSFPVCVDRNII